MTDEVKRKWSDVLRDDLQQLDWNEGGIKAACWSVDVAELTVWANNLVCGGKIDGKTCTKLTMLGSKSRSQQVLVCCKADDRRGSWITFMGGKSMIEALDRLRGREAVGELRWQEDRMIASPDASAPAQGISDSPPDVES